MDHKILVLQIVIVNDHYENKSQALDLHPDLFNFTT